MQPFAFKRNGKLKRDFESWAQNSLKDQKLVSKLKAIKGSNGNGEKLRETMVNFAKQRYTALIKPMQDAA